MRLQDISALDGRPGVVAPSKTWPQQPGPDATSPFGSNAPPSRADKASYGGLPEERLVSETELRSQGVPVQEPASHQTRT